MRKYEAGAAALIGAAIIGTLGFALGPLRAGWIPTLASVCVLAVLLAFDGPRTRGFGQSLGYSSVCGLLLATAAMYPVVQWVPGLAAAPADALGPKPWLPAIWIASTLGFLALDRVRVNTRPVGLEISAAQPVVTAPVAAVAPPPVERTPVAVPAAQATAAVPTAAPLTPAPAKPAEAKPRPIPRGTPATIYLNLVGTGIACLRAVKAEHLGKDFYRITEPVPAGEEWEFRTGQIVRCRKKTLSSGKAMVAVEEAPRAS